MKKAFTLAEVLITLMIVGVVAAMTVPTLLGNADDKALATGALKAYATLSNATKQLQTEKGPTRFWDLSAVNVTKWYKAKLNATTQRPKSYTTYYLNQGAYSNANMFNESTSFITSDGMLFYIQSVYPACDGGGTENWADGCINWGVDVNGSKPPNTVGLDIYGFYVNKDGDFLPEGTIKGVVNTNNCSSSGSGWSCSQKVVAEGKISW